MNPGADIRDQMVCQDVNDPDCDCPYRKPQCWCQLAYPRIQLLNIRANYGYPIAESEWYVSLPPNDLL